VGLAPLAGDGMYELRAGSTVGTVVLPSLRLLIRPKVALENLFALARLRPMVTRWGDTLFPYEQDPDLFKAMAWVFEAEVRRALAQGLVRGYQPRSETLTTLRGRIDLAGQLRARQGMPLPLECRFEEYTGGHRAQPGRQGRAPTAASGSAVGRAARTATAPQIPGVRRRRSRSNTRQAPPQSWSLRGSTGTGKWRGAWLG
jgi:hypothetical protein